MARFWEIDFFRAAAIVMMIIFHALFYIDYFGFMELKLYSGVIGRFQMLIPLIFLAVSGISSSIYSKNLGNKALLIRGLKLLAIALLITLVTWILFPKDFVFFGIIHLIASSIIIASFIKSKNLALILGIALLLISSGVNNFEVTYKYFSILGLKYNNLSTFDYYPLIPWLGVFLIGYYIGLRFYWDRTPKIMKNKWVNAFSLIGRHSLKIYFIHIIALFVFFWLLVKIFP